MSIFQRNVIAAVAALGVTAAPIAAAAEDEVVIGVAASFSGWMQAYSQPSYNAMLIAVDDINEKGGLLGKQIKVVVADAKTDRAESAKAGQQVLAEGAQMVAVDCDYDFGAPAALAAQNANKISIFLCAESVLAGIQGVGPASFSSSVLAAVQGATLAEWGAKEKGWKTAYILLDTTIEYNKGICYGFDWMWREKLGLEILGHDVYKNDDPSIAAQITRIKGLPTEPDFIINCSYIPGGASALRQIRAAGINSALGGGSSMSGTYWLDSVPGLTGHYVPEQASIYGDDPRPAVQEFNEKYKARFGEYPNSQYTYPGYLVVEMWARAVERAGSFETDAVLAEMNQFKDEPFLIGTRTFTPELHHQNSAPYLVIETTDGKPAVAAEFQISEPVPMDVLFGKRYEYIAR
ncbi:MAG: ABC transporter substrate-binding protein [Pikeienuella sp.]|uniref:ABC transporter substrate-binding protein n=1 Tax=Pikeienuella sp. TaxID=2831957 RepID=UPI00391AA1DF